MVPNKEVGPISVVLAKNWVTNSTINVGGGAGWERVVEKLIDVTDDALPDLIARQVAENRAYVGDRDMFVQSATPQIADDVYRP